MKHTSSPEIIEVLKTIARDRTRTNLLRKYEQRALAFLVQHIPGRISSDMLTILGFGGSCIVFVSFLLAAYYSNYYLLLGVLGFFVNWFGDSLDGRVAFYRNKPRKWYGFTLDLTTDWLSILLIGLGFIVYVDGMREILGYLFIVMYGWEIITSLLRYKITGKYSIDSGILGPTEGRIVIAAILVAEVFINDSIVYSSAIACIILFFVNISDTLKLLRLADERDINEKNGDHPR